MVLLFHKFISFLGCNCKALSPSPGRLKGAENGIRNSSYSS
uniref:Uncharacterized protein n=1 Tax=Rhizophora mucronata TaxID=61149 RepID=A0A2P2QFY6_RHIMU